MSPAQQATAARLRASDPARWTWTELARRFGVAAGTVQRAVIPGFREAWNARARESYGRRAALSHSSGDLAQ